MRWVLPRVWFCTVFFGLISYTLLPYRIQFVPVEETTIIHMTNLNKTPTSAEELPGNLERINLEKDYFGGIFRDHSNSSRLLRVLNISFPGLEKAKIANEAGNIDLAIDEVLAYYKRQSRRWAIISHTYAFMQSLTLADDVVSNTIGPVGGAATPRTVSFGKGGINWTHNPFWTSEADSEWAWGLHRQPFWMTLSWAYNQTQNETYAKVWVNQFQDWLEQCPRDPGYNYDLGIHTNGPEKGYRQWPNPINTHLSWAWRRVDAGKRAQNFVELMHIFILSPHFSRGVFVKLMNSIHEHVTVLAQNPSRNYTYENHGLYEAEGVWAVAVLFPEFLQSASWRKKTSMYFMQQMDRQVREDGLHVEGVVTYHVAAQRIFRETAQLSRDNNDSTYPFWMFDRLHDMSQVAHVISLPNQQSIQFGDQAFRMLALQPATDYGNHWYDHHYYYKRKNAELPSSQRLKYSGYYSIRSNRTNNASALILRCGPSPNAHMHKDAASFEFAVGNNIILGDAGAFTYKGISDAFPSDPDRRYFESTVAHNTLSLNRTNAHVPSLLYGPYRKLRGYDDCGLLKWAALSKNTLLVVENRFTYRNPVLSHRRTVIHFRSPDVFVLVDEAYGDASGNVEIHFHANVENVSTLHSALAVGIPTPSGRGHSAFLQTFANGNSDVPVMTTAVSHSSAGIGLKKTRTRITYGLHKGHSQRVVRFVTAIVPAHAVGGQTLSSAGLHVEAGIAAGKSYGRITLTVHGQQYTRNYSFDPEAMQMTPPPNHLAPEVYYMKYYNNFRRSVLTEGLIPTRTCVATTCDHVNRLQSNHRHLKSIKTSLIVVKKAKSYIYCGIPKCGVSKWRRLARRVEGVVNWKDEHAHTNLSGLRYLSDDYAASPDGAQALVNNPGLYMFTIVRNPYSRILSAWLDKKRQASFQLPQTFAEFVDQLVHTPDKRLNEHFAPLSSFCGLSEGIRYDAIYKMEEMLEWGPSLVKRLDLEEAVSSDWRGGFFQKGTSHATHADDKLRDHYTPELMMHIRWKYRDDFTNFGYSPQELGYH